MSDIIKPVPQTQQKFCPFIPPRPGPNREIAQMIPCQGELCAAFYACQVAPLLLADLSAMFTAKLKAGEIPVPNMRVVLPPVQEVTKS